MTLKVGIDLGTTNSVVAYMKQGRPSVVRSLEGVDWTPSVVQDVKGRLIVGKRARDNLAEAPRGTVAWSIKRFIGRLPDDPGVVRARSLVSYPVEDPPEGGEELVIRLAGTPHTPVGLSSEILRHMIDGVEKKLGERPTHAVITVPAYFTERQKDATRKAGQRAGLQVLRVLDEPSAAALAYGMDLDAEDAKTILVFDLGGGTFDVSVLLLAGGQATQLRIGGDNFLGGDDFDNVIVEHFLSELGAGHGDPVVLGQLKRLAEETKIALTTVDTHQVDAFLRADQGKAVLPLSIEVTRAWFERATRPLVERAIAAVHETLGRARLAPRDVDRVLMVGGSSRLPAVLDAVRGIFEPSKVDCEIDGMLCVALGAAVLADRLEADEVLRAGPGEAGVVRVVARPIGIELHDGTFDAIIEDGTVLPVEARRKPYRTTKAGQTQIRVSFFDGTARRAADNDWINDLVIDTVAKLPKGTPVDVAVALDEDGIMFVSLDVADKEVVVNARLDRVIRRDRPAADRDHLGASRPADHRDVAARMERILKVCAPILDAYPQFRDEWRGALAKIERAIEMRDDAARDRAAAEGKALLDGGLPPPIWAYYTAHGYVQSPRNPDVAPILRDRLTRAENAAQRKDHGRVHTELDELHGEVQGEMDDRSGPKPDAGPGGLARRPT